MRLSFLALILTASGCMSSSPRATVWSDNADVFGARYTGSADLLADSLVARGCVLHELDRFTCAVPGRDLVVVVRLSQPGGSTALVTEPSAERREATEVPTRDTDQGFEDYISPDGVRVNTVADDEVRVGSTSIPTQPVPRRRRMVRLNLLRVSAQVLDGGTPVRLGGDDAEALRASLYDLLVRQLPVTTAEYYDHRMRR